MCFSIESKYYLQKSSTELYVANNGYVKSKSQAVRFTELQIRNRFRVPKSYKKAFKEKLIHTGFIMIPVVEVKKGEIIILGGEYENDDILFCDVRFYFEKNIINKKSVYSPYRGDLRIPNGGKGDLIKAELIIRKIVGKVIK